MNLTDKEDSCIVDAYTYALGRSMQDTKIMLLHKLLDDGIILPVNSHEIKVDFNGSK
jgi:hypothetical protein